MAKYFSQFRDIDDKLYTIELVGDEIKKDVEFVCGGTPFITSMDSEDSTIYSPIKSQGATITLVTNGYPFDVYSGQALGIKATLYSGTETTPRQTVEWVGYVTPCLYDMGFNTYLEEIEIECVDGIAVLKNLPYSLVSEDNNVSFANILKNAIKKAQCYKYLYVSDNVKLVYGANHSKNGQVSTKCAIEELFISEMNFFDDKEDSSQTNDDVAWSAYDVIMEICRYLGYTCYAEKDEVFIVDYDAIKNNINTYYRYDLTTDSEPTKVTLSNSMHIDGDSYSETGNNISLSEVFNKVTVKDEFKVVDNVIPTFGDSKFERNITSPTDPTLFERAKNKVAGLRHPSYTFERKTAKGNNANIQCICIHHWRKDSSALAWQFWDSDAFEFHKYSYQTPKNEEVTSDKKWTVDENGNPQMRWSYMWDAHGAFYVKHYQKIGGSTNATEASFPSVDRFHNSDDYWNAWKNFFTSTPTNLTLSPMIVMLNHDTNHIGPGNRSKTNNYNSRGDNEDTKDKPYISLKNRPSLTVGDDGSYFIIKGTIRQHDEANTPFNLDGNNSKLKRAKDYKYSEEWFLWARLGIGNYFWNGSDWVLESENGEKVWFKLRWRDKNAGKLRCSDYFNRDFDFLDTTNGLCGGEKGCYIPTPMDKILSGKVTFELSPRDMYGDSRKSHWGRSNSWGNSGYSRYYNKVILLRNLKLEINTNNGLFDDMEKDSDTAYTNTIENGSINSMDDITFKVCTYDFKKPSYSQVTYIEGDSIFYVQDMQNQALKPKQAVDKDGGFTSTVQEIQMVYKHVEQYKEPRVIFEANLKGTDLNMYSKLTDKTLKNKTFIIDTVCKDYKYKSSKLQLVEKA